MKKSKVLEGDIQHLHFDGMISRGVEASNITIKISGSMSDNYPVVGKSIYEVEKALGQVINVNPYTRVVLVNGEVTTNDYIIQEGDVVEFVNEAYDWPGGKSSELSQALEEWPDELEESEKL